MVVMKIQLFRKNAVYENTFFIGDFPDPEPKSVIISAPVIKSGSGYETLE